MGGLIASRHRWTAEAAVEESAKTVANFLQLSSEAPEPLLAPRNAESQELFRQRNWGKPTGRGAPPEALLCSGLGLASVARAEQAKSG